MTEAAHILQKVRAMKGLDWIVLVVGLVIFTVISLWTITASSVWFDEAFGAYMIHFNFLQIAGYTAADVHPPFYYWSLKIWGSLFGMNEFGLRSMSTFFMAIAVVFGFLLVKKMFGRRASYLSLLFMVLSPMVIRYSQEMRMYAEVTAIIFAATYILVRAMETKKRNLWILYGVLISLGMWTHYFAALAWIAHWIWRAFVIRRAKDKGRTFVQLYFNRQWIIAHIVAIILFLPWLPALIHQVLDVQVNGFWIPPVTPDTLPNFFTNVLYYQDQDTVNSWMTFIFIGIVIATLAIVVRVYRTLDSLSRQKYMLILTLSFVPVALLIVLSMPPLRSTFVDRYLIPSTLFMGIFFGVTVALASRVTRLYWQVIYGLTIVAVMLFGISNVYTLGNYNKTLHTSNNTRQTIEAITARAQAGQPIITDSPWLFYEAAFYATASHPVYFINANTDYKYTSLNMLRYNSQHKIMDLAAFAKSHPVVWYVGRPGTSPLGMPDVNWKSLDHIEVNDSISGQSAYKAVEYQTFGL